MNLEVITWLKDSTKIFLGRTIELLLRVLLLLMPMGIFLILIQNREKASKISSISVFTNPDSVWQHIFPGFILVAVNPHIFRDSWNNIKKNFQAWVFKNQYLLAFLFMTVIVALMIWGEIKK